VGRVAQQGIESAVALVRAHAPRALAMQRERREPRDERLQLKHGRMLGAERLVELLDAMAEDSRVRPRRDGQQRLVVPDPETAAVALQPEQTSVEDGAVLIAEDRQQHLARELA